MTRLQLLSLTLVGTMLAVSSCEVSSNPAITAPESENGPLDPQSLSLLAPSNTWTAKRPIPRARTQAAAGTINKIIYVVGGQDDQGIPRATVQAYNVETNTWSLRQSMPGSRTFFNGASAINGRLYVTGGTGPYPGFPIFRTLFVYNPSTNTWARKAPMPRAGSCGAQGVIAGLLYVYSIDDCSQNGSPHRFFRYNPATDIWITRAVPPRHHDIPAAGVIGGKFYLAGHGGLEHAALDVYNPATNTWTTRAPMPEARQGMASAVIGGKLYVVGEAAFGSGRALRVYDPLSNTWITSKAPMLSRQFAAAGAAANGLFFVVSGISDRSTYPYELTTMVETYTP